MDPGADGRVAAVEQVSAGEEFHLGAVVIVGREHRPDHGDVVDAAAEVRPPVADRGPALAALPEADLRGIDPGLLLVDDVVGDLLADVLEERRVEDRRLVRGLADRLAGVAVERRLGVEALQVADARRASSARSPAWPGGCRDAAGRREASSLGCARQRGPTPVAVQHARPGARPTKVPFARQMSGQEAASSCSRTYSMIHSFNSYLSALSAVFPLRLAQPFPSCSYLIGS